MATSYSEKLRDPRWQRKRLEIWNRADNTCEGCGCKNRTMDVHHCWYEKGHAPWEYPSECFLLLCDRCHRTWHSQKLAIDKSLAGLSPLDMDRALGLLRGNAAVTHGLDVYIDARSDALTTTAIIRGFWSPPKHQDAMVHSAMCRLARGQGFWLSEVVLECVPVDEHEFAFIADWYERSTDARNQEGNFL